MVAYPCIMEWRGCETGVGEVVQTTIDTFSVLPLRVLRKEKCYSVQNTSSGILILFFPFSLI